MVVILGSMPKKPPYVIDPALQAAIDTQESLADDALADVALAGRDHMHPLVPTLTAVEARTHWLGLRIEELIKVMEYVHDL